MAVSAVDGVVTWRGPGERSRRFPATAEVARKVDGVSYVYNGLMVDVPPHSRRGEEIRAIALQLLIWGYGGPSDFLDVKVKAGRVALTGDVSCQFGSERSLPLPRWRSRGPCCRASRS
jgi:hypothetical protein